MLITPDYAREQARLHEADAVYGTEAWHWAYLIAGIAYIEGYITILDYGCGKGSLKKALAGTDYGIMEYDPAIPGKDSPHELECDLVVCLDVMEHIEPDCLNAVMAHLAQVTRRKLFVSISTKDSKRLLSNGKDSHILKREGDWWAAQFRSRGWTINRVWNTGLRLWVALMEPPK